jgi:hypothetical protein
MLKRFSPRQVLGAAAWLRPRNISDVAERADHAHALLEKIQMEIRQLASRQSDLARLIGEMQRDIARAAAAHETNSRTTAQIDELQSTLENVSATVGQQERQLTLLMELQQSADDGRATVASLDTDLQFDRVCDHVRRVICSAVIADDPFPHAVLSNVLPDSVHEHMVAALPPSVFFDDRPLHKARILRVPLTLAPAYSRRVWNFLARVASEAMAPVLLEQFRSHIDQYIALFGSGIADQPVNFKVMDGRLLLRRAGYVIPPHRDPRWGFLTMLLYVVRPGETEAYGTQLYHVPNDADPQTTGQVHYFEPEDCELVRHVPFRSNTALIFLNSRGAHGASIPPEAPAGTERYVYQLRVGPDTESAGRIVTSMTEESRLAWAKYRGASLTGPR